MAKNQCTSYSFCFLQCRRKFPYVERIYLSHCNALIQFIDIPVDKGQKISEVLFDVFKSTKKSMIVRISALASKQRSDQKNKDTLHH